MSNQDINESFSRSAERMSGDNKTIAEMLTREHTNDPASHEDIHQKVKVNYESVEKAPSMEEIHKWKREHIMKDDQSKEGYPLNVILDPATGICIRLSTIPE